MASCKEPEAAAALVALYGKGSTVRLDHGKVLWREGTEDQEAGESYDYASHVIQTREQAIGAESYDKVYGAGAADRVCAGRGI